MANASFSFWQMGEELRSLTDSSEDQSWSMAASQLAFAEQVRSKGGDRNTFKPLSSNNEVAKPNVGKGTRPNKYRAEELKGPLKAPLIKHKPLPEGWRLGETGQKSGLLNGILSSNGSLHSSTNVALDKRFKSLPPSESLPRHETLGGYIFVCNNDTMQEDLRRNLFGLPQRYRDSVRAIQPGLPLFLYNYTTHQLHGVFEATSFGGTNIDPTAWEDKKCKGESRFPAQVRIRVRQVFKPLEEDSFRPILHHYDGPKFRLQLSIPETLALLDLFVENELSGKAYGQCAPLATFNIYNFENHHKGLSPYVLASGIKA